MQKFLLTFICTMAMMSITLQSAYGDSETTLSVVEAASVDEAVEQITAKLENQGFEIVLLVNHAAAADSVGLELRPTQVIFARLPRQIERPLLKRSPTIGIDLPLKYLVFEDENGEIRILSNAIGYLVDRHNLKIRDPLLSWLQSRADQFSPTPDGLITIASNLTLEDTVESLKLAIPSPPFRIPLELDFNDGRERDSRKRDSKYRKIRSQVLLVFGNPLVGTPLMQEDQRIGLDLPQKFLVWEDRKGEVNVSWNDPFFIAGRYNIQAPGGELNTISGALKNFAEQGTGN